jgi:hypothetical protein
MLIAVLAVGAQLGVIDVLSIDFSDAIISNRIFASVLILLVAIFVVYDVVRTVRGAADKFGDVPRSRTPKSLRGPTSLCMGYVVDSPDPG